jgi:predicted small lipoprotein YifL
MRKLNRFFVLAFFLAGCGSSGNLYLPEGEKENVAPESIEGDTFQPETEEEEEEGN